MNRCAAVQNKRLYSEYDLSKSSAHNNIEDILNSIAANMADPKGKTCANHGYASSSSSSSLEADKQVNKVVLVNKASLITQHHGAIMEQHLRLNKRSKPRVQSGPVANITAETFKLTRPYLPRDDSILLLKHKTTNSIPMIVPLFPADGDDDDDVFDDQIQIDDLSDRGQESESSPLARIQRRRKPRRMSGVAVADETRPILERDDSVVLMKQKLERVLMKKKLAGNIMVPLTFEMQAPRATTPNKTDTKDGSQGEKQEQEAPSKMKDPKNLKSGSRLTMRQKQKGFVRQNSLTPPCA